MTKPKKKNNRQALTYDIQVCSRDFEQIECGGQHHVIVFDDKKEGYEVGDLLIIQKVIGRKRVGGPVKRTILNFQKRSPGLLQGWIVLSFVIEPELGEAK